MPQLVVLGGAVMDVVFRVHDLPQWKEAVQAYSFDMFPGGKGLNQAVAAARLGANASLISAVGDDAFGDSVVSALDGDGVDREFVEEVKGQKTPVTAVFVSAHGIRPAPDAAFIGWKNYPNIRVGQELIERAADRIRAADMLLITLEVPLEAVRAAVEIARSNKVRVILNPAPPLDLPDLPETTVPHTVLQEVEVLIPNVWEASRLLRRTIQLTPQELACELIKLGPRYVCVTTAEMGCVVANGGDCREYPGFASSPSDTTGGSDAFCASLAIALAEGKELKEAIILANAAGAIAVGKLGGYPSMPFSSQLREFLRLRRR